MCAALATVLLTGLGTPALAAASRVSSQTKVLVKGLDDPDALAVDGCDLFVANGGNGSFGVAAVVVQ